MIDFIKAVGDQSLFIQHDPFIRGCGALLGVAIAVGFMVIALVGNRKP